MKTSVRTLHRCAAAGIRASCATLLAACALAHAQSVSPSQVTPPTTRPAAAQPPSAGLVLPPGPAQADTAEQARLEVQVGRVQVEGGRAELAEATRAIVQSLEGRRVSLLDIRRQAEGLESAYQARGLFLVRVTLPPQQLKDAGVLRIAVIDGFIEQVDASGVPAQVREPVERTLQPLVGRTGLTLRETERRIGLARNLAGLRLRSAVVAGERPGGSRLILEGELRSANASLNIDNGLSRSLGFLQALLTVSFNSPFGAGERLYAAVGTGRHPGGSPFSLLSAGAVAPVGIEGWTVNPEFTRTTLDPQPAPQALRTTGRLLRSALRLSTPVARLHDGAVAGQFAIEHTEQQQDARDFGVTLSSDRYTALRLGGDATTLLPATHASLSATAQWSQGLGGRKPQADAVTSLSRQGASPDFRRLQAQLRMLQPLRDRVDLSLVATGQGSFGAPLMVSEQFALSGPDGVSGYPAGSLAVDEGATLRSELSWALPPASIGTGLGDAMASAYIFVAGGHGRLLRPTAVEPAELNPRSAGIGLRAAALAADGGQAQLSLELARHSSSMDEDGRRWRLSLRLGVSM